MTGMNPAQCLKCLPANDWPCFKGDPKHASSPARLTRLYVCLPACRTRTCLRNTCAPRCATPAHLPAQHLRACLRRTHYCLCMRLSLVLLEVLGDFGAWFCRKAVFWGMGGGVWPFAERRLWRWPGSLFPVARAVWAPFLPGASCLEKYPLVTGGPKSLSGGVLPCRLKGARTII